MIITYHGGQCFKVSFGDTTIAFDPPSKESKNFEAVKFGANAAFISLKHPDFNGKDQVSHGSDIFLFDSQLFYWFNTFRTFLL